MAKSLRILRKLIKTRLAAARDLIGYNLAGFRAVAESHAEKNAGKSFEKVMTAEEIWGELGLGSDVAAALSGKKNDGRKRKQGD